MQMVEGMHASTIAVAIHCVHSRDHGRAWEQRMKTPFGLLALVALAFGKLTEAQTRQDEKSARELPQAFSSAWAKHDGHELAKIMAEDVDFVTVGATWLSGRSDFEKYHTRLLSGRFKESTATPLETAVRF